MTCRAPQEPTREFKPSYRLRDDLALHTPSLGCAGCPDFKVCGGPHTEAGVFDCNAFCSWAAAITGEGLRGGGRREAVQVG